MNTTVIRAGHSSKAHPSLRTLDLADHLAEARAIIRGAQEDADVILTEARAQNDRAASKAHDAGYDAGFRKGQEAGREAGRQTAFQEAFLRFQSEQSGLVADCVRVVNELDSRKQDLLSAAERHLLEFAVLVAEKLTRGVGELHSDAVIENLRRAIKLVGARTDVVVRANSRDLASLETFAKKEKERITECTSFRFVSDDTIAPGGCVVESPSGRIDASLETQVVELVSLLLGRKVADEPVSRS